jgi:hypothetical protein
MDRLKRLAQLEAIRWAASAKEEWVSIELRVAETEIRLFKARDQSLTADRDLAAIRTEPNLVAHFSAIFIQAEKEVQLVQEALDFWVGRRREAYDIFLTAEERCDKFGGL